MEEHAEVLLNRLTAMNPGSEGYDKIFSEYESLMKIINNEQKRLNGAAVVDNMESRIQADIERAELEAEVERQKLKVERGKFVKEVVVKIVGGIVMFIVNVGTIYTVIRFNNTGETLTSTEMKFISPYRDR
jgi:pectin methylesterase-like acyl-CoA thioesterase